MNHEELIKALRECYYRVSCNDCPIFDTCDGYIDRAMHDAADAIEALNRLVDLNTERCEGLRKQLREAQEQYEKHLNELEQQLPKRSEWQKAKPKGVVTYSDGYAECSHCHETIWLGWGMNFCPHCGTQNKIIDPDDYDGAKMEVQE